jgi:hypothetical protein
MIDLILSVALLFVPLLIFIGSLGKRAIRRWRNRRWVRGLRRLALASSGNAQANVPAPVVDVPAARLGPLVVRGRHVVRRVVLHAMPVRQGSGAFGE